MYHILILEDDVSLSNGILLALRSEDISLEQAYSLREAGEKQREKEYDLYLVDINLPDGSGIEWMKELRRESGVPVILLTANDLEIDIVTGLELGADDYITKPFSLMVLRARVRAQLRKKAVIPEEYADLGRFRFLFAKMEFYKDGQAVQLSKTEQKLLYLLLKNRGMTMSRAVLTDRIWTDGADFVDENALSVAIKRLRDKLEDDPARPEHIKTVYGFGYTWI